MRVAITGHTSGIGKALFDLAVERGHDVLGFSRSNGYDISSTEDQEKIVKEVADFDVFINNAHERFSQVEMFTRIWASWKDTPKKIINIGTAVTLNRGGPSSPQHPLGRAHYAAEKAGLEMAINWAWCEQQSRCEAILIRPGLTSTPRTANDRPGSNKIDPGDMARYIMSSLDQPFVVRELTITPRKNNA